jgi:hypothetical protein
MCVCVCVCARACVRACELTQSWLLAAAAALLAVLLARSFYMVDAVRVWVSCRFSTVCPGSVRGLHCQECCQCCVMCACMCVCWGVEGCAQATVHCALADVCKGSSSAHAESALGHVQTSVGRCVKRLCTKSV